MSLRSRLAMSRRVKIGSATAVAGLALLGSGLSAPVSASAPTVEAPAPAVQKAVKQETKQAAVRRCRIPNCYGAIHLAWDGGVGLSNKARSKRRANEIAHARCLRASSRPCHRLVWVKNGCAAVAYRYRNGQVIKYWAVSRYRNWRPAVGRAKYKCRTSVRPRGLPCRNYAYVCTPRRY